MVQQINAIAVWQQDVRHQDVEMGSGEDQQGLLHRRHADALVAATIQMRTKHVPDVGIVIDDQNAQQRDCRLPFSAHGGA